MGTRRWDCRQELEGDRVGEGDDFKCLATSETGQNRESSLFGSIGYSALFVGFTFLTLIT